MRSLLDYYSCERCELFYFPNNRLNSTMTFFGKDGFGTK